MQDQLEYEQTVEQWLCEYDELNKPKRGNTMDMSAYAGSESNYLKASDIKGTKPKVKINRVELVEFENDGVKESKPCAYFEGKEKALVCNSTSVKELINTYGTDSNDWIGNEIILGTKYYDGVGKEGIVITALPPSSSEPSDDIPF